MVAHSENNNILAQANSITELLSLRAQITPAENALADQLGTTNWNWLTWANLHKHVTTTAQTLRKYNCGNGDAIAIIATTSLLWDISQYAILENGWITVGIDSHDTQENIQRIVEVAAIKGIITDNREKLGNLLGALIKNLEFVVEIEVTADLKNVSLKEIHKKGTPTSGQTSLPSADDTATIIFTSGTSGEPKGIPYSHKQVLTACQSITNAYSDVTDTANLACWLPLSNLFQRMMNYCAIAVGAKTYYVSNPKEIIKYLPLINPTVFIAVPRFYEKLYAGIQEKIGSLPLPAKLLFSTAHNAVAWSVNTNSFFLEKLVRNIAGFLVFNRLKKSIFGHNLNYAISGSAPMPIWLLNWFDSIGVLILEAYGISENIIPNACNTPLDYKFGTVGKPVSPNEIRLSRDNEIEVKGPGLFCVYLGQNKERMNITEDGYLLTGDEGEIDADGFITLKGRKADFFKTSTGKRISPLNIEKKLKQCPLIENAFILGEGRKVPIACANLSPGYDNTDKEKIAYDIGKLLSKILTDCPSTQKPAAILLLLKEFSIQDGEITANLKIRKKHILNKYAPEIDRSFEVLQRSANTSVWHQITDNSLLVKL